jgi:hypothetical protein
MTIAVSVEEINAAKGNSKRKTNGLYASL